MSAHEVRRVLLRAQTDDLFYEELQREPEGALSEYSLTSEERDALIRQDQTLNQYLVPSASGIQAGGDREITVQITIKGKHDWINVVNLRETEALPPEVTEKISQLAERVLGAEGAERVDILITMLQLLDGRQS